MLPQINKSSASCGELVKEQQPFNESVDGVDGVDGVNGVNGVEGEIRDTLHI